MTATSAPRALVGPRHHEPLREHQAAARARSARAKAFSVVLDGLALVVAMAAAFPVAASFGRATASSIRDHVVLGLLAIPVWLVLCATHDLYTYRGVANRIDEWRRLVRVVVTGSMGTACIGFMLQVPIARGWVVMTGALSLLTLSSERTFLRWRYRRLRADRKLARRVILVGGDDEALELAAALGEQPELGQQVVGLVHREEPDGSPVPYLGCVDDLLRIVSMTGATGVLIAPRALPKDRLNRTVRGLIAAGIHVEIASGLRDIAPSRLRSRAAGRFPVTYVEPVRHSGWRAAAKRAFDVVLSAAGLVVLAPVLAASAIAVKLDSPGPALFRQERVGKDGEPFTILKLRTMTHDAEERIIDLRDQNEADGPLFKLRVDPRVTRSGRILRKLSIDEIPQLFNVLCNQMSLVGPRPALPSETERWSPELFGRLQVKPGITGMWQVSGRSNASFDEYVRLDLYYVDNWSLVTDLGILVKTVPAVLSARGAC